MNKVKYSLIIYILIIVSGCGSVQPVIKAPQIVIIDKAELERIELERIEQERLERLERVELERIELERIEQERLKRLERVEQERIIEAKIYDKCVKKCNKFPEKITLFKNGFKKSIKYPVLKATGASLSISGEQWNEDSNPNIGMFFLQGVNQVFFVSNAPAKHLLKSLYLAKKDWSKIPKDAIKRYKPYNDKYSGYIAVSLINKKGRKHVQLYVTGKYEVHTILMQLNRKKLNLLIKRLEHIKKRLTNRYTPCVDKCNAKQK